MRQRKVELVLGAQLEQRFAVEGLALVGERYPQPSSEEYREGLSGFVDSGVLETDLELLDAVDGALKSIEKVGEGIIGLEKDCKLLSEEFDRASSGLQHVLEETQILTAEKHRFDAKASILSTFTEEYLLSESEQSILEDEMDAVSLSESFLQVLERMEVLRRKSKELGANVKRGGLEILSFYGDSLEQGYEKVCRWSLGEIRKETGSLLLEKAMSVLRQREQYLSHVCDEYFTLRKSFTLNAFRDVAETFPMDSVLHRVSDMLAWVHQSVASEKESAISILQLDESTVKSQVDKCFSVLEPSLTVQMEHVMGLCGEKDDSADESNLTVLFSIYDVILFYTQTIQTLLTPHTQFSSVLTSLSVKILDTFFNMVKLEASQWTDTLPLFSHELAVPQPIQSYISVVTAVFTIHEQSLSTLKELQASSLINSLVTPILAAIDEDAVAVSLKAEETLVYRLNVFDALRVAFVPFECASARVETLAVDMGEMMEELVLQVSKRLLRSGGLLDMIELAESGDVKEMDKTSLGKAVHAFTQTIGSFGFGERSLPPCDLLQRQQLRLDARKRVGRCVVEMYSRLYCAIDGQVKGYGGAEYILRHTPEQLALILDL